MGDEQVSTVLDAVKPTVDRTMNMLAATKFLVDPIAGEELSRITSIISSAYKRDGAIIEVALFEAISRKNGIEAEGKVKFFVNRNASAYVEGHDIKTAGGFRACLQSSMPNRDEGGVYEIDIIYFDHQTQKVVALEVKRGNGQFDRGKRDAMIKSALTVRSLLSSYAEKRGWTARGVESRIVAYYGVPKFPPDIYLRGADLNTFIGPGIYESVEEVNEYFRTSLLEVLDRQRGQREMFH